MEPYYLVLTCFVYFYFITWQCNMQGFLASQNTEDFLIVYENQSFA